LSASSAIPLALCANVKAPTLRSLLLADNEFGDIGAGRFVENLQLRNAGVLETASFAQNAVTDVGAIAIGTAMIAIPSLKSLDLSGNCLQSYTTAALKAVFEERLQTGDEAEECVVPEAARAPDDVDADIGSALSRLSQAAALAEAARGRAPGEVISPNLTPTKSSASATEFGVSAYSDGVEQKFGQDLDTGASSTSFMTPVRLKPLTDASSASASASASGSANAGDVIGRGRFSMSGDAVVSSARELRAQVASLDAEVSSLVEELQAESITREPTNGLAVGALARASAGGSSTTTVKTLGSELIDMLWAFIFAALVLMILVSLVQSQDEYTFSLKPI
jgi:hypothetical protein